MSYLLKLSHFYIMIQIIFINSLKYLNKDKINNQPIFHEDLNIFEGLHLLGSTTNKQEKHNEN